MCRNEHVLGSPFLLRVQPAMTQGQLCLVSGAGLALGAAGENASFMIEACDSFGNSRGIGGDLCIVDIVPARVAADASAPVRRTHRAHVRDCKDGWYEVSYNVEEIGRYLLHISVGGEPIVGSPSHLVVSGGRTYGPATIRRGASPKDRELPTAIAGVPYAFVIEARDDFDVPRGKGGDQFAVVLSGPQQQQGQLLDLSDGSYEVSFAPALDNCTAGVNEPLPGGLTPRAQALASTLDGMFGVAGPGPARSRDGADWPP